MKSILAALCFFAPALFAQVDTGTIAGTLTDSTGAVLPGAPVVIRQTDTGQDFKLSSNALGQYVSPPLAPGPYEVSAEKSGFRRTITHIELTLNLRAERGNSSADLRQRFIGSWTWSLPFGQSSHGVLNALVAGWQANGIVSLYGGLPFTPSSSINTLNGSGSQRPNRIASGVLPGDQRTLQRWFDTAAFVTPAQYQFSNSGVNILRGPGTEQVDFSMFKSFYFSSERGRFLQFRGEMFNLFNMPQFNNPNAAIGGAGAGTISSAGSKPTFQRTSRNVQLALKIYF